MKSLSSPGLKRWKQENLVYQQHISFILHEYPVPVRYESQCTAACDRHMFGFLKDFLEFAIFRVLHSVDRSMIYDHITIIYAAIDDIFWRWSWLEID